VVATAFVVATFTMGIGRYVLFILGHEIERTRRPIDPGCSTMAVRNTSPVGRNEAQHPGGCERSFIKPSVYR
jgi:hypothetical protein